MASNEEQHRREIEEITKVVADLKPRLREQAERFKKEDPEKRRQMEQIAELKRQGNELRQRRPK